MQRAADIAVAAHQVAMRAAKPGVREYELQAGWSAYSAHGCAAAYASIVGAGNACVLHYVANNAQVKTETCSGRRRREYRGYAPTSPARFLPTDVFPTAARAA